MIKSIHALLQFYNIKGELLARPLSKLYDHLRDFWVYEDPQKKRWWDAAPCSSAGKTLLKYAPWPLIRNSPGTGHQEDNDGEDHTGGAVYFKITDLFTLTYRPTFFKPFGFFGIDKNLLPIKVWSDCIGCVSFPNCNETAMLKKLG